MEVGPTGHYIMGGVRVDAETGAATVPGLFAAENPRAHARREPSGRQFLSDLLVHGMRAGAGAAAYAAKALAPGALDPAQVQTGEREMLEFFERPSGPDPYSVHRKLQDSMQALVGIFRTEGDLQQGIEAVQALRREAKTVRVEGSRAFNPGWHLAHDLRNMLIISEVVARCALQRKESRGAHARDRLSEPGPQARSGEQLLHAGGRGGQGGADSPTPDARRAPRAVRGARGVRQVLEETVADAVMHVFRGDASGGKLEEYKVPMEEGMVVLDAIHHIQAIWRRTSRCAGTARPPSAAPAPPK